MTGTVHQTAQRSLSRRTWSAAVDYALIAALAVLALIVAATLVGVNLPEVIVDLVGRP